MSLALTVQPPNQLSNDAQVFEDVVAQALQTVAPSSARVYGQTYRAWAAWAHGQALSPFALWPVHVGAFLDVTTSAKGTRQRQLSALRRLAKLVYIATGDETALRMFEGLRLIKAPVSKADTSGHTRRALSYREADRVLGAWDGNDSLIALRNRALVAVLALSGMRRAEAVSLRWMDVDLENGVVRVAHGKGDKPREAALAGPLAVEALARWRGSQGEGRDYVFCSVGKGGRLGRDVPITGTDVYRIIRATEQRAGVEFRPHDLRRTFITEALATGVALKDVQVQVGHANGETTLRYAQPVEARKLRHSLNLRYGRE